MTAAEARWNSREESLGLPPFRVLPGVRDDAIHYLELSPEGRRRLTPEQCADAALTLAQYAAYVHRVAHRAAARCRFAEEELAKVAAPLLEQYSQYMKVEDKRRLVVAENTHAAALEAVRVDADALRERTTFLAQRVYEVGQEYRNLSFVKRKENQF